MTTSLRPKVRQVNYRLVHSRAPDVLRMYHDNITQNHRVRQVASITMPSVVSRARLIVDQRSFIPIVSTKVDG